MTTTDVLTRVPFQDGYDDLWLYSRFLEELKNRIPDPSSRVIGSSEAGKPLLGFTFGDGPVVVSLVAGAHADEPVGPNTLYRLILEMLDRPGSFRNLYRRFRFLLIPHLNPDGDAANASWITRWPDPAPFLAGMKRELPGRDIEFGYPGMRPENRSAVAFWEREKPVHIHFSLHGMQFSEGFLLLINDEWEERSRSWQKDYTGAMHKEGLQPHDHDRGGEKGFNYMGPGFTSTPKGSAMRDFFLGRGDAETASLFHSSSMEYHIGKGREAGRRTDTLCMVTEFPLFLVRTSPQDGVPEHYLALKKDWTRLKESGSRPEEGARDPDPGQVHRLASRYDIRPVTLGKAMRLQRMTIRGAMDLAELGVKKTS